MKKLDQNARHSLKAWLLAREIELLAEIESGQEAEESAADAVDREVNDQQDQAGTRERTTIQDAEIQRDSNELADVRAALVRLADGSYGICVDCGKAIDMQRLIAKPSASRCIACQIKDEERASWV